MSVGSTHFVSHYYTKQRGGGGSDVSDYIDNKFCSYFLKKHRHEHQFSYIFKSYSQNTGTH